MKELILSIIVFANLTSCGMRDKEYDMSVQKDEGVKTLTISKRSTGDKLGSIQVRDGILSLEKVREEVDGIIEYQSGNLVIYDGTNIYSVIYDNLRDHTLVIETFMEEKHEESVKANSWALRNGATDI